MMSAFPASIPVDIAPPTEWQAHRAHTPVTRLPSLRVCTRSHTRNSQHRAAHHASARDSVPRNAHPCVRGRVRVCEWPRGVPPVGFGPIRYPPLARWPPAISVALRLFSATMGLVKPHLSGAANGRFVHGHATERTPTYVAWRSMIKRCRYPSNANWAYYGGRGIRVCDEWLSFDGFLRDMGERPKGKTLDRINVDDNYGPWNCRWVTRSEQQAHRRGTKRMDRPGSKSSVEPKK